MLRRLLPIALFLLLGTPALAQDDYEEITIYGDLFARWDDTRWFIKTEVALPYLITFEVDNFQFRTNLFQIRTVLNCAKQWRLGVRRYEVDCEVEDYALVAAVADRNPRPRTEKVTALLQAIDRAMTEAKVQLQVADNGRVTNIQLEGFGSQGRRKDNQRVQTLTSLMTRAVVGFDMKLRKNNNLNEGQWVEYNSALMSPPTPPNVTTRGSSQLIHQLNKYKGHRVVQSVGRGMMSIGIQPDPQDGRSSLSSREYQEMNYDVNFNGVSIYDHDEGYMTERVWSLNGQATAGSFGSLTSAGPPLRHLGRIQMLDKDEKPSLGESGAVTAPGESTYEGEMPWRKIEE